MKKQLLLDVDYIDKSGKFFADSYIKNKIFTIDPEKLHKEIAETLKEDMGMEISYKNKPQANIFIDDKNGNTKTVGYLYRAKTDIEGKKAYFDAWVVIKEVKDFPIKEIN